MIKVNVLDYNKQERAFIREMFAKGMKAALGKCAAECNENCLYFRPCTEFKGAYLYIDAFCEK